MVTDTLAFAYERKYKKTKQEEYIKKAGLREEILTKLFKLNILVYREEIYEIFRRLGEQTLLLKLIHQHHAYCKQEGSTILEL